MNQFTRRYDIDWLRVISVLLLIPFHTAIMFSLNPDYVVYVKSTIESPALVMGAMTLGIFHMPLLFVLAGMSISYSLNKRSGKDFLKERVTKLLIPILGGILIWNQLTTYIYQVYLHQNSTLLAYYLGMFSKPVEDFTGRNGCFTVIHFWFATFLFVFSVVGLPLFKWLKKPDNRVTLKLAAFFEKPLRLALLTVPFAAGYMVEILDDKNPIAYFMITFIGFLLATDERYQRALDRDKWVYLVYSIGAIAYTMLFEPNVEVTGVMRFVSGFIVKSAKLTSVYTLLGLGHCYFNQSSPLLSYLSKSSFTIYTIHMLMNTIVGYFILKTALPLGIQWLVICVLTYLLSFGFYEIIKRTRWVKILFGMTNKGQMQKRESYSLLRH